MEIEVINSLASDNDLEIEILDVSTSNSTKIQEVKKRNPVEEKFVKELHYVDNLIRQTKNNIAINQTLTSNILEKVACKFVHDATDSSDTDSDWYSTTGEPVIKKKKKNSFEKQQVIEIKDVWQRVIDDKWIIGVVLHNTTTCKLENPTIYICRKDQEDSSNGVSIFWTLHDGKVWIPSDEINSEEELIATVVLDLPCFDEKPAVQANGTIFCQFDDKLFQAVIPELELAVENTVDGSCNIDFEDEARAQASVLSLKAISVDRIVLLPLQANAGMGKRLTDFLTTYSFTEICKICVMRDVGTLQYCLLEVFPTRDDNVKVLLSARSEAQLSAIVKLMQEYLPEMIDVEKQQAMDEAAEVLLQELELYLTCGSAAELQRAKIKTDLLIP